MIDICIALDQSVSPHTGVRTIQNTGVFWEAVFQTPRPTPFFGSRLRRQNFNHTIPPAAQAIRLYVDDDGTECKHKCKTVMFVRNKGSRNGVL